MINSGLCHFYCCIFHSWMLPDNPRPLRTPRELSARRLRPGQQHYDRARPLFPQGMQIRVGEEVRPYNRWHLTTAAEAHGQKEPLPPPLPPHPPFWSSAACIDAGRSICMQIREGGFTGQQIVYRNRSRATVDNREAAIRKPELAWRNFLTNPKMGTCTNDKFSCNGRNYIEGSFYICFQNLNKTETVCQFLNFVTFGLIIVFWVLKSNFLHVSIQVVSLISR